MRKRNEIKMRKVIRDAVENVKREKGNLGVLTEGMIVMKDYLVMFTAIPTSSIRSDKDEE